MSIFDRWREKRVFEKEVENRVVQRMKDEGGPALIDHVSGFFFGLGGGIGQAARVERQVRVDLERERSRKSLLPKPGAKK